MDLDDCPASESDLSLIDQSTGFGYHAYLAGGEEGSQLPGRTHQKLRLEEIF